MAEPTNPRPTAVSRALEFLRFSFWYLRSACFRALPLSLSVQSTSATSLSSSRITFVTTSTMASSCFFASTGTSFFSDGAGVEGSRGQTKMRARVTSRPRALERPGSTSFRTGLDTQVFLVRPCSSAPSGSRRHVRRAGAVRTHRCLTTCGPNGTHWIDLPEKIGRAHV